MRVFCDRLVNAGCVCEDVIIEISGEKVCSIEPQGGAKAGSDDVYIKGGTVIPGLIDIHIHGAACDDFSACKIEKSPAYLASRGTTGFLPTPIFSINRQAYLDNIVKLKNYYQNQTLAGAKVLGVHLEGPFLNPAHGAQGDDSCWQITDENVDDILAAGEGVVKLISLSPELAGAAGAVRRFEEAGIVTAATHTEAGAAQMQAVYDSGLRHITHIFNAMDLPESSEKGVRATGCAEFALAAGDMTADIIVDSEADHVTDEWIKIALKCLGGGRLALLSDAMPLAGMEPGLYPLPDGREICITAGCDVAYIEGVGLAGSVMTIMDVLINLMERIGLSLEDAIGTASLAPAKILKIDDCKGSVEVGKDADIVVVDDSMGVLLTMVDGKIVYRG